MRPHPTRWGPAAVAGLAILLPATSAHAQYSLGYDSLVNVTPSQTFWYNSGYQSAYTDPSTGVYQAGEVLQGRTVAPYANPPYGAFQQGSGLPTVVTRTPAVAAAPARRPVLNRRPALLRRRR